MNLSDKLGTLNILNVTHTYATGPAHALDEFLRGKAKALVFIEHPFSYAKTLNSTAILYIKGKKNSEIKVPAIKGPQLLLYLKDFLTTFFFVFYFRRRYDLYVGSDSLNALVGLILKTVGIVDKVVFYTIDYIPKRFENPLLNKIYHEMDDLCVKYCDFVWNLSSVMADEREKNGIPKIYRSKQITVPIGTDKVKIVPFENINRYQIVHMGHLLEKQGIELLVDAMPEIIETMPKAQLLIVGSGPMESKLKTIVKTNGLEEHVIFKGFINDHKELLNILAHSAIGVAPYVDDENTYTRYTDPGKPKAYMAAGLPVIITKVPQVAFEIEKERCGFAINYDKKELTDAIVRLLSDEKLLKEYRLNAINFAKNYNWEKIFTRALAKVLD